MAKLYLKNEIFTISGSDTRTNINGSTEVYGTTWGFGTSIANTGIFQGEDVRLSETAKNVTIDANVENIEFTGQLSEYNFTYINFIGSQGTTGYIPAHLEIRNSSLGQTVSIASINQPVKLLFSEGSYNLTQTGKAVFQINGSSGNVTFNSSNSSTQGPNWSDGISPFSEKSTIQPTIKPSIIKLPYTHTNAVVQVESGHNITVNNFKKGDALDLFPNASISVVPDSSNNNLTFKLNDGSNNETTVTLSNSGTVPYYNFASIYNLSSFLSSGYNIISHNTLSDFSTNSNFDASGAPLNLHFNITGNSLGNNIIGSTNSDTISGGNGFDTITGGGGADSINLSGVDVNVQIFQSMGDSVLRLPSSINVNGDLITPIDNPLQNNVIQNNTVNTSNLDVITGLNIGNPTIFLTQYTNASGVLGKLDPSGITTLNSLENVTQYDNKIFVIHGTYDLQNHNFTQSTSAPSPDTLLVYDGNAATTTKLEAIVLPGYTSTVNIGTQYVYGGALVASLYFNGQTPPVTNLAVSSTFPIYRSANADAGNFEFDFATDASYTFTISNFATDDKLRFPMGGGITFPNSMVNINTSDNTIELDWTLNNYTIKVILTGVNSSIDSTPNNFNTTFPGGIIY